MTDPIADMLTRIRNALINRYGSIEIPASNIKVEIARVLKEEGYIGDYGLIEDRNRKVIKIELKYTPEKEPIITEIPTFLLQERDGAHMHIGGVAVFEGPPPGHEQLRQHISERLALVPRFRQ